VSTEVRPGESREVRTVVLPNSDPGGTQPIASEYEGGGVAGLSQANCELIMIFKSLIYFSYLFQVPQMILESLKIWLLDFL